MFSDPYSLILLHLNCHLHKHFLCRSLLNLTLRNLKLKFNKRGFGVLGFWGFGEEREWERQRERESGG
jgi:hypothetical protein